MTILPGPVKLNLHSCDYQGATGNCYANYIDFLQSFTDLLVKRTTDYTKMLTYGTYPREEFAQCKQALAEIHAAIELIQDQETHQIKLIVPENEKSIE